MTVAELIAKLGEYPPEAEVTADQSGWDERLEPEWIEYLPEYKVLRLV